MLCALTLVGLGVASTSLMQYPWQLILMWGVLVGMGTGFLATVLSTIIAARWFTAQRGLALGILSGGASTGQLIFLPVMANVTAAYGWRTTVLAIAGVLCVVIPLVALIMRDRPQDVGLAPYGETGHANGETAAGQSDRAGVRRTGHRGAQPRHLDHRLHVFRLRRLDQRADRNPPDSGLHRHGSQR